MASRGPNPVRGIPRAARRPTGRPCDQGRMLRRQRLQRGGRGSLSGRSPAGRRSAPRGAAHRWLTPRRRAPHLLRRNSAADGAGCAGGPGRAQTAHGAGPAGPCGGQRPHERPAGRGVPIRRPGGGPARRYPVFPRVRGPVGVRIEDRPRLGGPGGVHPKGCLADLGRIPTGPDDRPGPPPLARGGPSAPTDAGRTPLHGSPPGGSGRARSDGDLASPRPRSGGRAVRRRGAGARAPRLRAMALRRAIRGHGPALGPLHGRVPSLSAGHPVGGRHPHRPRGSSQLQARTGGRTAPRGHQ